VLIGDIEISKQISQIEQKLVPIPNWLEADQLPFTKRGEIEFRTTEHRSIYIAAWRRI